MFNRKPLLTKKSKRVKISYDKFTAGMKVDTDPNLMSHKQAILTYNFDISNGALQSGNGFADLCLPIGESNPTQQRTLWIPDGKTISGLFVYRFHDTETNTDFDRLLIYCDDKKWYWYLVESNTTVASSLLSEAFNEKPILINYNYNSRDSLLMSSPSDDLRLFSHENPAQTVSDGLKLISMCIHNERAFAVAQDNKKRLLFSKVFDPTNWTASLQEGGFIDFSDESGNITKVISFGNYVYAIRDYGITRISAYGDQTDFSVSHIYDCSQKIYGESVCVCGDLIVFLAKDGIYICNGSSVQKLDLGMEKLFNADNGNCSSAFHNEKYYLACKLDYNDGNVVGCENESTANINNSLIELDMKTFNINLTRGVDISCLFALKHKRFPKLIACFNGLKKNRLGELTKGGKCFTTTLSKIWLSPLSNLGYPNRKKIVREIVIKTSCATVVTVRSDKESKTYGVPATDTTKRIKTFVRGDSIQVEFKTLDSENVFITLPEMVVEIV